MTWWERLLPKRAGAPASDYVVPFRLYSADGKKSAEVRVRRDGKAYFVEQERFDDDNCKDHDDNFKNRGLGEEIGPYETPELAEAAAVARAWFKGRDSG